MLSRRKEQPSKEAKSADKVASSTSSSSSSSYSSKLASTNSKIVTSSTSRGEKRKSNDNDPHDEKGSEYLRRKHNFIKSTIRVDYQPDICKDYKETGFCGFGDSCKFLHDRSDYKHGWQLDQDFAKGQYKDEDDNKYLITDDDDGDGADQEDASKCCICKETYKDPIVTKCKHYFCGTCAEKECCDKCYTCEKPTSGIFKVAKIDLQKKETEPDRQNK